jgi:hypothetical protein
MKRLKSLRCKIGQMFFSVKDQETWILMEDKNFRLNFYCVENETYKTVDRQLVVYMLNRGILKYAK